MINKLYDSYNLKTLLQNKKSLKPFKQFLVAASPFGYKLNDF